MKPIAMKCNASQYEKIKPILLQNGFKEVSITCFKQYPYLINNFSQTEKRLGNGCRAHLSNDRKLFEEWNEDIFLEYCGIKPEWKLPEKWCIDSRLDVKLIGKWFNENSKTSYDYTRGHRDFYYHYPSYKTNHTQNVVLNGYTEITLEQFKKYVLKKDFVLPEKWCIESTPETYEVIKDYLVKNDPDKCNWEFYERNDKRMITSRFTHLHPKDYKNDNSGYTLLNFEQFQTHILNKKSNTMQTLTLGQLKDLYVQFGCTKWKSTIEPYLKDKALLKDDVEVIIDDKDIQLLLKEGSYDQKQAVEKLGIALSNPIEWDKIKTGSKVMLERTGSICVGSSDGLDFDKPFNVIFFKTPYYMLNVGFRKCSNYTYCVFNQDGKFATFQAQNNTDYIVSVIEY